MKRSEGYECTGEKCKFLADLTKILTLTKITSHNKPLQDIEVKLADEYCQFRVFKIDP